MKLQAVTASLANSVGNGVVTTDYPVFVCRGFTMPEVAHVHKCPECGEMWTHLKLKGATSRQYHEVHNCPNPECKGHQRWIYAYVDETESYPGEFEDRHRDLNRKLRGGRENASKTFKPDPDEEILDFLLAIMPSEVRKDYEKQTQIDAIARPA